jgi:folate-dependent phosphoribosylglycinamide formyltransferase PurN
MGLRVVLFSRVPRWYSFRGERLVMRLTAAGHEVVGVVVEKVPTLTSFREWIFKLGLGRVVHKSIEKGLRLLGLKKSAPATSSGQDKQAIVSPPVFLVDSHNSPACVAKLSELKPDVIVLRGCGIIKKPVLDIPSKGMINPHYAVLPTFRGMDVTEWSALLGAPIAVSVHFVDVGVDTGAVLAERRIPIEPGDTLGALRDKSAAAAADLLVDVVGQLHAGTTRPVSHQKGEGQQYFVMHPRLRQLANERLRRVG